MEINVSNLVLDLDDTCCRTNCLMVEKTLNGLRNSFKRELADKFMHEVFSLNKTTLEIEDKELKEAIWTYGLSDGKFMLEVKPTPLFNLLFKIPGNTPSNVKLHICTHRAWHKSGKSFTQAWFDQQKPYNVPNSIHVLDSKENPNKLEYLDNIFGDDYLLIDDNPCHNVNEVIPFNNKIRVFKQYKIYPAYEKQKQARIVNGVLKLE